MSLRTVVRPGIPAFGKIQSPWHKAFQIHREYHGTMREQPLKSLYSPTVPSEAETDICNLGWDLPQRGRTEPQYHKAEGQATCDLASRPEENTLRGTWVGTTCRDFSLFFRVEAYGRLQRCFIPQARVRYRHHEVQEH